MNADSTVKIKKETKNKIKVDFARTPFWQRMKAKYFTFYFLTKVVFALFRFVLLVGVSYVILFPFFTKIASSFMSPSDVVDSTVKYIPKSPTLDIYKYILLENHYLEAFGKTFLLSACCAILQTFVCSLIGYGFAKFKFKGSKLLFALVLFSMIVPHQTLQLSMFMKFRYFDILGIFNFLGGGFLPTLNLTNGLTSLNLTNTFWPLILLSITGLGFKNGLYIFMMRQYYKGVPDELEESAYVDGSNTFHTFFTIILPISVPMMITIFLFSFSWQWTDNFYTDLFFTKENIYLMRSIVTIPPSLDASSGTDTNLYNAAIRNTCGLLIIFPLVIMYLFCQRYLIQGIERSGITG